jgi:hypothetical protein
VGSTGQITNNAIAEGIPIALRMDDHFATPNWALSRFWRISSYSIVLGMRPKPSKSLWKLLFSGKSHGADPNQIITHHKSKAQPAYAGFHGMDAFDTYSRKTHGGSNAGREKEYNQGQFGLLRSDKVRQI